MKYWSDKLWNGASSGERKLADPMEEKEAKRGVVYIFSDETYWKLPRDDKDLYSLVNVLGALLVQEYQMDVRRWMSVSPAAAFERHSEDEVVACFVLYDRRCRCLTQLVAEDYGCELGTPAQPRGIAIFKGKNLGELVDCKPLFASALTRTPLRAPASAEEERELAAENKATGKDRSERNDADREAAQSAAVAVGAQHGRRRERPVRERGRPRRGQIHYSLGAIYDNGWLA